MYIKIKNPHPDDSRDDENYFIKVSAIYDFDVTQYQTRKLGRWYRLRIRTKYGGPDTIIRDKDRVFIDRIINAITGEEECISLQKSE